ncbi:MAG: 16S rRNA (guanine(527)-N(7))-methyltransferase RsmG [Chloroflexi bacterium]|nr:16S rRNA (guanine(527)-N(7))-methyltransferase RsmG [Chloroflexota bacterium]
MPAQCHAGAPAPSTTASPADAEAALADGARRLGLALTEAHLSQFRRYYRALVSWNRRANLTAITEYGDVLIRHFLDSLTVTLAIEGHSLRLLDVGSGAGFPGVPLRLALPQLQVTLLEATEKKTAFLRHLRLPLELPDLAVVTGRVEQVAHDPAHRESYDLVVSRGVDSMATLAEYQLPFCRVGGRAVAMKKGDIAAEVGQAQRAMALLGGRLLDIVSVPLPQLPDQRCLVVVEKVSPTPDRYPRRPGMPAKRPLV